MKAHLFKTLRGRLTVMLISPVVIILLAEGVFSFIYARNVMLDQWNQIVTLQLARAASEIDRRLSRPLELIEMFTKSEAEKLDAGLMQAFVLKLENLPGIVRANLNWHSTTSGIEQNRNRHPEPRGGQYVPLHQGASIQITPPVIDAATGEKAVSLTMALLNGHDMQVGDLEIVMRFNFLVADIAANAWWQNAEAYIAERASGRIILTSGLMPGKQKLGETGDMLETRLLAEIDRQSAGAILGSGHPPERVAGYHRLDIFPWVLVVFADGKTVMAPIIKFRNGFIIGAITLVVIIYGIIRLNVDRMSATITKLSRRAGQIAAGDYGEKMAVPSRDEIGQLATSFNTMVDGLKEMDAIRNTFGRYVDPEFARTLLKAPEAGRLGGRRQEVAIFLADIRGFTATSEHLSPEVTIELLNRYFSAIIPLVQKHGGIIVDFVGDGILGFFEPVDEPLSATVKRCVKCAFDMQDAMVLLNLQLADLDLPALQMGIGVNSGPVVVGNIGSESRKKYGIVGASVNIAQRIQGQSNAGEVVVSEAVYGRVKTDVSVKRAFLSSLKGVVSAVQLVVVEPNQENTIYK